MAKHFEVESAFETANKALAEAKRIEGLIDLRLETLIGLAQTDAETEQAYLIVADGVMRPELAAKLREFAADHQRHVRVIAEFLEARVYDGGIADPEASAFVALAGAMVMMSAHCGVAALQANEYFTNAAYAAAIGAIADPEARRLLAQHHADEQRHAQWLSSHQQEDWDGVVSVFGSSVTAKA